ncbi:MAG: hypothetical protein WC273_10700 [Dehalococcoidia bacterium]
MPKGPQGQKRPGDVIGAAIRVAKIATGEIPDDADPTKEHHRKGGQRGGPARAASLTPEQRSEIAKKAAAGRPFTSLSRPSTSGSAKETNLSRTNSTSIKGFR